jgi:MtrB/PioB family decaheme-associated outer membrane protein
MSTKISRSALLATAIGALLAGGPALADKPTVDTSNWKCESCPFLQGYDADASAGAIYADGANAAYGRFSGIEEDQAYVDAGATGQWRTESGAFANYSLQDLGLESRSGRATLGREGRYDFSLYYDGIPWNRWDDTVTPFTGTASLALPSNWVRAGTTGGMTRLAASLGDRDVETLRKTYGADARYLAGPHWAFFANYRRQEKSGTGYAYASFLTQAVQLPEPVDYVDDTFEVGASWNTSRATARLALSGSYFRNLNTALTFQNPYSPLLASSGIGRIALAPDNDAQQLSLSGNVNLGWNAVLTYGAAIGKLQQDDALLPVSTAANARAPRPTLDGEIDVAHYNLGLSLRPLDKLSLRGTARYDERDDKTDPLTLTYVVTDTIAGSVETTPRYSYQRTRLDGSADYGLFPWLRIGGGLQWDEIDRDQQEVAKTTEDGGFLRARVTPLGWLALTLKGGQFHREADGFDLTRRSPGENPLLRKYNLANRDRTLYEMAASIGLGETVTVSLQGRRTDDVYRRSPLGLTDGDTTHVGGNVSWAVSEALNLYFDAGHQRYRSKQLGQAAPAGAAWEARNDDEFYSLAIGGRWKASEKLSLNADLVQAESRGDTTLYAGAAGPDEFPEVKTRMGSVRLGASYQMTPALAVGARVVYEGFDEDHWAYDGVTPAAAPQLLSMNPTADTYDVFLVAFNFTYRFGNVAGATAKPE